MNLEEVLRLGEPMAPLGSRAIFQYNSRPLIGTFQIDGTTVLFWAADAPWGETMRYVYVVLSEGEAIDLTSHFQRKVGECMYENNPLLTGRRVVVGASDKEWSLAQLTVIERSGPRVFDEVDELASAAHD
jgi:hypothetical protein